MSTRPASAPGLGGALPAAGATDPACLAFKLEIRMTNVAIDRSPGEPTSPPASPRSILLAILFAVLALPTVMVQVYLTPPIQVADEENHFLRALQVADGQLVGLKIEGGNAGGLLDPEAPTFAHAFDALKFRPDLKLDPGTYAAAAEQRWGSAPPAAAGFPNTAIYPFFLYLPASAGLAAGRGADMSVLDSFYLARAATASTAVALAALSLWLCDRGRTLLFVILCFPMTLSLFASVSQDALSIALGAVAAAVWSRSVARGAAMPAAARAVAALALGAVAAARLPLAPLYLLALMPTRGPVPALARPRRVDVAAAAAGLVPLVIGLYGAHAAKIPFRVGDGVSPVAQLRWMGLHPLQAGEVAIRTLADNGLRHLREMVGVLGWLDTDLPTAFYLWMLLCALAALLIDAVLSKPTVAGGWRFVPLAGVFAATAGVFAAFYLAWTPVGAPVVDGVQGRYFIVPAMILAVSLPSVRARAAMAPRGLGALQVALCAAVAIADLWVVPTTLLHRYYG